MPSLKKLATHLDRVTLFNRNFDSSAPIMISLGTIATAGYALAAYYAPTDRLRNSMIVSAVLTGSVAPFTALVIIPVVKEIKSIVNGNDNVKAMSDGDRLLDKWSKLNLIRWILVAASCLNGLKELTESTLI